MMNGLETDVESRSEIETEQQRYHKDIAEIIVISPECDATYVIKLHFLGAFGNMSQNQSMIGMIIKIKHDRRADPEEARREPV